VKILWEVYEGQQSESLNTLKKTDRERTNAYKAKRDEMMGNGEESDTERSMRR